MYRSYQAAADGLSSTHSQAHTGILDGLIVIYLFVVETQTQTRATRTKREEKWIRVKITSSICIQFFAIFDHLIRSLSLSLFCRMRQLFNVCMYIMVNRWAKDYKSFCIFCLALNLYDVFSLCGELNFYPVLGSDRCRRRGLNWHTHTMKAAQKKKMKLKLKQINFWAIPLVHSYNLLCFVHAMLVHSLHITYFPADFFFQEFSAMNWEG